MHPRSPSRFFAAFSVLAALAGAGCAVEAADRSAEEPLILVHYMPWFEAPPVSARWGWHWTMNTFDPQSIVDDRRQIAAHYYPLVGPYDSGDPAVLEYHLLLMKLAGIDGVVADWYGLSNHFSYPVEHRNTSLLFRAATAMGLKIAVCYEDQTITRLVEAKKLAASDRVRHARAEIAWLRKNWFADAAYARIGGKPLLLSFGFAGLTDREWEEVLPAGQRDVVYLSEHRRRSAAAGAFDWPVPKDYPASLERFFRLANDFPVAMPVAFPRFHDIYAEAEVHASWGSIADDGGRTWADTLQRALESQAPAIQLATWNDWGEGTAIEPSLEFGYRDLETLQRLRRELVDSRFAYNHEDLRLPHRLYRLRRLPVNGPELKAGLDQAARLLATGSPGEARRVLDELERVPPER